MEDKIEIEEYVRTEDGIIDKVTEYRTDCHVYYCEKEMIIDEDNSIGIPLKQIVKHSKQLIDLIECGDYVNGREVLDIYKPRDLWEPIEIRVDSRYTNFILADEIETILTKEQMETNYYKVGGEK